MHDSPVMVAVILLAAILSVTGCQTPPQGITATPPLSDAMGVVPEDAAVAVSQFLIAPTHELEIKIPERPDLSQSVRVPPDGRLSLPYIGSVMVAGRTPEAVEGEIGRRYRDLGAGAGVEKKYLIAVNDELQLRFPYAPTLDQTLRVRPDGRISAPLAGTLQAEGRSPEELEADLIDRYSEVLKRPELTVVVLSFSDRKVAVGNRTARAGFEDLHPIVIVKSSTAELVYVGGEVGQPGVQPYRASLTLLQAIVTAGGEKGTGEMSSVVILRKMSENQAQMIRRDLRADLEKGTTNDVYLQPSDIVIVPKTTIASVNEFLYNYIYTPLPITRNSTFGLFYNLREPLSLMPGMGGE